MDEKALKKTAALEEYSLLFKALGEETRLKILGLLEERELCVCDFMEVLDLAQSTASRHLAYLKNAGWVTGRREGKWMYYRLHPGVATDPVQCSIIKQISRLQQLQKLRQRLQTYLEQKDETGQCS